MKKLFCTLLIILIILFTWQINAYAFSGAYMVLEGGWAKQAGLPSVSEANAVSLEHVNFPALRGAVGYIHDFNLLKNKVGFGLEIGYGDYSKSKYRLADGSEFKIHSTAAEFLSVIITHFNKIDAYAKIGGIRHSLTITGYDLDQVQIRPEAGIGASYNFTPHFAVSLNYTHAFSQSNNSLNTIAKHCLRLNEILAGIRITFF